jgi:cytochrome c oxidase assembly factor CtaG
VIVNIEASVMHYYFPHFQNYWFSFKDAYYQITDPKKTKWLVSAFVQGGLFTFIFSFAGASHFSKSPLLKTLFTFSILVGGYFLFAYLLYKGLNLREYSPVNGRILFVSSQEGFAKFLGIAITIMNLIFLTIAYFRLKEKEV